MMELNGLTKSYNGVPAIQDVSLEVQDDEYLTLLGPSGSGKSTLLRLLSGLEQPDSGEIRVNGEDVTYLPPYLRGLGFVQQNYALIPHLSVADNVAFGLRYRLVDPVTDEAEVARRVHQILDLVGMLGFEDRMVGEISGGQKQRVSLARTLVTAPKICLLDEPLGALDANLRERMTVELRKIRASLGVTFLHVTGNEAEALAMGDRMIVLDSGRVIQADPPETVFGQPASVHVARFVSAYNILEGATRDGAFVHGERRFDLPSGTTDVAYYAIRHDAVSIEAADAAAEPGKAALPATFIASEFLGSRIVYFFQLPGGGVFEVERHLSRSDPVDYRRNAAHTLCWNMEDALFFAPDGHALSASDAKGAA